MIAKNCFVCNNKNVRTNERRSMMKHLRAGMSDDEIKQVLKDYISNYETLIFQCKTSLEEYEKELKQLKNELKLYK